MTSQKSVPALVAASAPTRKLLRHGDRTLGCVIEATAHQLGQGVTKKSNTAKALLIDERKALEVFFIEMNRTSSPG